MPFPNLETTLPAVAANVNNAIQQTLTDTGHSKSGRLQASVNTSVVKDGEDYQLQTTMLDYGLQLDARYNFIVAAIYPIVPAITSSIEAAIYDDMKMLIDPLFTHK